MKQQLRISTLLALGLIIAQTQSARAANVISTFDPGGADTEVREAAPTTPRGTDDGSGTEHFELGMRENSTHNGHVYMKFGVQNVSAVNLLNPITVRTHWSLNNIQNSRIEDENDQVNATFADTPNVLFDYYVLDPTHPNANWNEATTNYNTAPSLAFDGNFATDDLLVGPGQLAFLGTNELRSLNRNATQPIENRIPIGEAFDITFGPGSPLHLAIVAAQLTGHKTVTIVSTLQHDFDDVVVAPTTIGVSPDWNNHNYVFMPKEKGVVGSGNFPFTGLDGYDNDTTDTIDWNPATPAIDPPNSPWQGQLNTAANPFAPQLLFVPEPSSLLLVGIGGLSLLALRRRA